MSTPTEFTGSVPSIADKFADEWSRPLPPAPAVIRGRGTARNPLGRFEACTLEEGDYVQPGPEDEVRPARGTVFYRDHSKSALTRNESPDVGFTASVNPYRGCEHGCVYCYARPTHEYLGLSAGLDFETRIFVKEDAPELLRTKLASRSYVPEVVNLSGVTDCYQPIERKLGITRRCIEVLLEFGNPFTVITKNRLVTRDIDLFARASDRNLCKIFLSVTSLDPRVTEVMEPRTSRPSARLAAIEELARAGVRVGAMIAPVVPAITDHEMPAILQAIARAGATEVGYVPLRLPYGLGALFEDWLVQHFPDRKEKVLHRVRELRGGRLNDPDFGSRMRGEGVFAEQLRAVFHLWTRKLKLNEKSHDLTTEHFKRPTPLDPHGQLTLF